MKKAEVVMTAIYCAKVSGARVPIRLLCECPYGGWDAVNLATGRRIRIRTAGRLTLLPLGVNGLSPAAAANLRAFTGAP